MDGKFTTVINSIAVQHDSITGDHALSFTLILGFGALEKDVVLLVHITKGMYSQMFKIHLCY